ncbi:MAG: hypothetical protein V4658_13835 [Bacteroidota bacterium]
MKTFNKVSSMISLVILGFMLIYTTLVVALPAGHLIGLADLLAPLKNRETGLIETLQHVVLLLLAANVTVSAVKTSQSREKVLYAALCLFFLFVLLEETDYLMNYIELLTGKQHYEISVKGFRNIHNNELGLLLHKIAYWIFVSATATGMALLVFKEKNAGNSYKITLWFVLCTLIMFQFIFSIAGKVYLDTKLEAERQIMNETLELNIYTSWLFYVSAITMKRN